MILPFLAVLGYPWLKGKIPSSWLLRVCNGAISGAENFGEHEEEELGCTPAVTDSFIGEHGRPFSKLLLSLLDVAVSVGVSVGEGVGIEEDAVWDCETGMLKAGGSLPVRRKDSSVSASRPNQGSLKES